MNKILFTEKAEQEINDIIDYIAINLANPKAANDLYNKFEKTINKITDFPLSCPFSTLPFPIKLRKAFFGNYVLFYEFNDDTITVFSIQYAERNHTQIL